MIATGSAPAIPPIDGLEGPRRRLDQPRGDGDEGGAREHPDPRRRPGRRRDEPGARALRREGDRGRGRADRLLPARRRRSARRWPRRSRRRAIELRLGAEAEAAGREGDGFTLTLKGGEELRAEKLLVATGRKPNLDVGLDAVGIEPGERGIEVDERLRAGDGVWAIGDVTGIMPFTHVGKYQARIAAEDMLGNQARADYRAVPRVVFTDPQVAAVGEPEGEQTGTCAAHRRSPRTSTYARNGDARGFLTLVSDGTKLTGAYAVGPEAGDWLGQATLAVRAGVPIDLLRDTIQPYPTFSEAYASALADLG